MALGKTTKNREGKENEYEEEVASLYEGMDLIVWFEASAPGAAAGAGGGAEAAGVGAGVARAARRIRALQDKAL